MSAVSLGTERPSTSYTAPSRLIPIIFNIDVEPDGFFIDRRQQLPWTGYEASAAVLPALRERVERATGRSPRFTWLYRLDPQVAETYGSPDWPLARYPQLLADAQRHGDDIGVHIHPFRWSEPHHAWIADFGNQAWIENCVHMGCAAYRRVLGRDCLSLSMGNHWMNNRTFRVLEELGIRYDLSVLQQSSDSGFTPELGFFTGECPDFAAVPRRPYVPSLADFRVPDPERTDGAWVIPLNTQVAGLKRTSLRSLGAALRDKILRKPPLTSKFLIRMGPSNFRDSFDHFVEHAEQPYFVFSVRSALFALPDLVAQLNACVDFLLSHREAHRFVFATPAETVELVCSSQSAAQPQSVACAT